jgi:hypothetical protein
LRCMRFLLLPEISDLLYGGKISTGVSEESLRLCTR